MNITSQFYEIAEQEQKSKYISKEQEDKVQENIQHVFNTQTLNLLLTMNNITKIMVMNKDKYYSNSNFVKNAFSDEEKDDFEKEILKNIKMCSQNIEKFSKLLEDKDKKNRSFMDYENIDQKAHKQMVIIIFKAKLTQISSILKDFKTHRLQKQEQILKLTQMKIQNQQEKKQQILEKRKNRLNLQQQQLNSAGIDQHDTNTNTENFNKKELELQNKKLVYDFQQDSLNIQDSQKKLVEISQLISQFGEKLQEQEITTEQILQDAKDSMNNVKQANYNLIDAKKYNESVGSRWSILFLTLSFILLILDYLK